MNRYSKAIFFLLTCVAMTACGWHLKGQHINPTIAHTIYLSSFDSYGEISLLIKNKLKQKQILSDTISDADYHLHLIDEKIESNTLSVSDVNSAAEYEIVLSINYQISNKAGEPKRKESLKTNRHYQFNKNRVIAKEKEQQKLLAEMRNDLADRLIRQLGYLPSP